MAGALLERGVGVEAGIFSGTDADHHFRLSPHRGRVLRVLAEVTDRSAGGAATTAEALLARLHPASAPILLHGEAAGAWPVLRLAARRGFAVRIGLEDTLVLPDGQIATDNAELVAAARAVVEAESR